MTGKMTSEIPCDSNIVRLGDKTGWGKETRDGGDGLWKGVLFVNSGD